MQINVIGAGLAGSEAAYHIAKYGLDVNLYEMRPNKMTPAHETGNFAELVCTNSLRSKQLNNAAGLLKEEMKHLDSIVIKSAFEHEVPAGGALAVDRNNFSKEITDKLKNNSKIHIINDEFVNIPENDITVIATGPLTSDKLSDAIKEFTDEDDLHFFDAAAPILDKDSLDMDKLYFKSRYDRGEASYLNAPMNEQEYKTFYNELVHAETAEVHDFENSDVFEGCMPVEVMAQRGEKTLLYGPLKPVGLNDPRTGEQPYAVVQLRQDNAIGNLYNIVGFQTHLKWGEQKRVFGLIPGLEDATFVRYGVMHRNSFLKSPKLLQPTYQTKKNNKILFAGQITGVEGYIESAASGIIAGLNAVRLAKGMEPIIFPNTTMVGAMAHYITHADPDNFQPMNANWGIVPSLDKNKIKVHSKKERNEYLAQRAIHELDQFIKQEDL